MFILKILSALTFASMIFVNYLANALPLGGNTTGDISGKYQTLFTPSGFTFSIWGVIYVLLSIFLVMLFINPDTTITQNEKTILILFNVINVFNVLWLLAWHHDRIFLSTIVMLLLLTSLLVVVALVSKNDGLTYATFSIYAGWISVATIANIAIWITKENFSIFMNHERMWFFIILGVSFIIGLLMVIKQKNYYYGAVFMWAYFGILMRYI